MKTINQKKLRNLLIVFITMLFLGLQLPKTNFLIEEMVNNEFLVKIQLKLKKYNEERPEDRVYLQFDKPIYKPGETIWFSAFVRNGTDLKPSAKSDILHVELFDPKGNIVKKINLIAKNGKTNAEFYIDKNDMGGLYKVKAYTNWQKNVNTFFEKEIQIQKVIVPHLKMKLEFQRKSYGSGDDVIAKLNLNTLENKPLSNFNIKYIAMLQGKEIVSGKCTSNVEGEVYVKFGLPEKLTTTDGLLNVMINYEGKTESISRSIPITLGNIDLSFFPEGGDLIAGLPTYVAFKAMNEFGKATDIEGVVKDINGKEITTFKSFHNGMGAFEFTPEANISYRVYITNPKGINKEYVLPEIFHRGWVLNIKDEDKNYIKVIINSTEDEQMSLICQIRGIEYFSRALNVLRGKNELIIDISKFPIGVAQITLFDSREIERAERLAFVNKHKQMNIEIITNKEKYSPREKVSMTLKVTDERGLAIPANLSMAVVDDKVLSFADDKSGNILSSLLLEQDILSKVEEAKFYFDPKEDKADKALDYLLMTEGWRRFKWVEILQEDFPAITNYGEKAVVAGTIINDNGKLISGAYITLNDGSNRKYKTDNAGKFHLTDLDLYEPIHAVVSAADFQNQSLYIDSYREDYNVYMYKYRNYNYKKERQVMAVEEIEIAEEAFPDEIVVENAAAEIMGFDMIMEKDKAAIDAKAKPMLNQIEKWEEKGIENEKALMKKEFEEVVVGKELTFAWDTIMNNANIENKRKQPMIGYYRSKEFAAPNYTNQPLNEIRTDFRSCIYWNGNIAVNNNGLAHIEFYNNDDVTSFRTTVEGIGAGMVGRAEKIFYTQLPFSMFVKVPPQVVFEDTVSIPLTLKNTTDKSITGTLSIVSPKGFKALSTLPFGEQTLSANSTKTIYLDYQVLNETGEDNIQIFFKSDGLEDAFIQNIKIGAKGFPVAIALSGQKLYYEYTIDIINPVEGSITASLTAFPNVVNDLMTGIESIIREPSGCFEQTSMSNYPNIMALNYMKEVGMDDASLLASIENTLDRGYKKLCSFETKENGYEWFGSAPGHEALTAYGLMQFNDMKKVYADVNIDMLNRTTKWMMNRKDGNGGFKMNPKALDQFGRASEEVTNGYIVYALSEAGYKDIQKELELAYKKAIASEDGYLLSMMANTLQNMNDKRAEDVMKKLLKLQNADGSFPANHSITRSGGLSLKIETTAIAALAILNSNNIDHLALSKTIEFIVKSRCGNGSFGSTQGTVLALKALSKYAAYSKKTKEAGTLECYIDGNLVASKHYEAGEKESIKLNFLEKYLQKGKHKIKVQYKETKNALPYTLAIDYNTFLPKSSAECDVVVSTQLSTNNCLLGETVRLTSEIKNKQDKGIPMTMTIIGIPSGLSAQSWQLKELQEKGKIDFYELSDSHVIFYFRDMAPQETHLINIDLKAEVPGIYEAPASSAYLYYTNEYKCWISTGKISIRK